MFNVLVLTTPLASTYHETLFIDSIMVSGDNYCVCSLVHQLQLAMKSCTIFEYPFNKSIALEIHYGVLKD